MPDTLGRYLRHVAPGNTGTSNLFRAVSGAHRPLLSGATQILLTNNLNHLRNEATCRTLYTGVGFQGFYRGAPSAITTAPTVDDIDWRDRNTAGTANLYLPSIRVPTHGARRAYPTLVLKAKWRSATNGGNVGAFLGAAPGRNTFPSATDPSANTTLTNTTYQTLTLTIDLSPVRVRDEQVTYATGGRGTTAMPVGEGYAAPFVSVAIGFYNSRNQSGAGNTADVVQIALYLRPPT